MFSDKNIVFEPYAAEIGIVKSGFYGYDVSGFQEGCIILSDIDSRRFMGFKTDTMP
jgi:hypothetical protein